MLSSMIVLFEANEIQPTENSVALFIILKSLIIISSALITITKSKDSSHWIIVVCLFSPIKLMLLLIKTCSIYGDESSLTNTVSPILALSIASWIFV